MAALLSFEYSPRTSGTTPFIGRSKLSGHRGQDFKTRDHDLFVGLQN